MVVILICIIGMHKNKKTNFHVRSWIRLSLTSWCWYVSYDSHLYVNLDNQLKEYSSSYVGRTSKRTTSKYDSFRLWFLSFELINVRKGLIMQDINYLDQNLLPPSFNELIVHCYIDKYSYNCLINNQLCL